MLFTMYIIYIYMHIYIYICIEIYIYIYPGLSCMQNKQQCTVRPIQFTAAVVIRCAMRSRGAPGMIYTVYKDNVCMYVCIYIYIYIHIHTYTYNDNNNKKKKKTNSNNDERLVSQSGCRPRTHILLKVHNYY